MADSVQFSRPTSAALAGKQTQVVKTLVTDEFKDDMARFWRSRGYQSESDFVREALLVTVYGPEWLADLHRQRIASLVRTVPETSTGAASGVPQPEQG